MLADDRDGIVTEKRRPPGEHLVEQRAERIQIRARRHLAGERLFRRHVRRGADHRTFLGKPSLLDIERQAKVAELGGAIGGQPDVARLEVAVHDAAGVGVLERLADLISDAESVVEREVARIPIRSLSDPLREGALSQPVLHRPAGHELADDKESPVLLADVVHRDDVRMIAEARHGLRLALDAPPPGFVEPVGSDDRERDFARQPRVLRQVDTFARSFAEEAPDLIAAGGER